MNERRLLSDAEIASLLESEVAELPSDLRAFFNRHRVAPTRMPFAKPTTLESAFVVARRRDEAIYYEEVEGGFNSSTIDSAGRVTDHWFGQDSLRSTLWSWMSETPARPHGGESSFLDVLNELDINGALDDRHRQREFMLRCIRHLNLPAVAEPWVQVAQSFVSGTTAPEALSAARVEAWKHLGNRSCDFRSPSVNTIRAIICILYPDKQDDAFDEIANFVEFFCDAGGSAEVAIDELERTYAPRPGA